MRAGQADRKVTIQKKNVAQDANNGSDVVTWVDFLVKVPAEFEWLTPTRSEVVTKQAALDRTQGRLRLRYRTDINSAMRVVLHADGNDTTWQIVGGPADIEGRKRRIEMYLEAYTSAGDAP